MSPPSLHADCSRCVALCCVAFAFDRGHQFAIDKAAGVACPHLGRPQSAHVAAGWHVPLRRVASPGPQLERSVPASDHGCGIHSQRAQRGFPACVRYDCLGAGQRVTQEIFGGRSWRTEPELTRPMLEAFAVLRSVHELLELLLTAARLPLDAQRRRARLQLLAALHPSRPWDMDFLRAFDVGAAERHTHAFLRGLREVSVPLS